MRPRRTVLPASWSSRSVASMDTASRQIEDDARAEIASDPRIPHPAEIAVEVVDGIATLRGTVGSFAQRHAAVADARRSKGVEYVDDWLQVRLLDGDRRQDAEIRGAALQRLEWDSEIPGDAIRVSVKDGWVTLKGNVVFQYQSDEAFNRVASLHGVTGVTNEIRGRRAPVIPLSDGIPARRFPFVTVALIAANFAVEDRRAQVRPCCSWRSSARTSRTRSGTCATSPSISPAAWSRR